MTDCPTCGSKGLGELVSLPQVADQLNLCEMTIYRFVKSGDLPAFKIGNSWRVRRLDLEEWIRSKSNQKPEKEKKDFVQFLDLNLL